MKYLKFIILLPFLLLVFLVFGSKCNLDPKIESTNNNSITSEVVPKNAIIPGEQFLISSGYDITLGVLNYSSAASTFSHFMTFNYDIYIYFNEDTDIYRSDLVYTLNILDTNTFDVVQEDSRRFSLSITQPIPITELISVTLRSNLYGTSTANFDNNLRANLILDINASNNVNYNLYDSVYTAFSPTIRYLSWEYIQPGGYRTISMLGYSDMYAEGIINAYNTGYDTGYGVGYDDGYDVGYNTGYPEGYNFAFELFENSEGVINNMWSIIAGALTTALTMLSVHIMPGIPLYIFLIVPLVFGIIFFIWKGGTQ